MNNSIDPEETVENEAKYKGYQIILSNLGKVIVIICRLIFIRRSLKEATDLIDQHEQNRRN